MDITLKCDREKCDKSLKKRNQMAKLQQNGFHHSVPVPNIYKRASKIAREVSEGKNSIKNLVFQERRGSIKAIYALVVETFKRDEIIMELIEKSKLLTNHPRFNPWLAKILITELLWGKNKIGGDSKPIQTILGLEKELRELLPLCCNSKKNVLKHSVVKPRYVRVNTLKITVQKAIENFVEEGWVLIPPTKILNYEDFLQILNNLKHNEFMVDMHIPNLLIFPPKTEFHQHEAYKSSSIILQDKASCLPVHLLSPTPGSTVIDMCAAPGMKTTQLAAMLKDSGIVYAVELDVRREKLLRELVDSSGATCVKIILKDVMRVKKEDFPNVEYVLVDPSCSGSGITDRVEVGNRDFTDRVERLRKLNNFQSKLLRHALNAFPKAKRIVYSTCSINSEENEDVIRQVLETCKHFKLIDARKILKSWNDTTSKIFPELGNMCVYATPEKDKTNGFFVAVFERLGDGERNPFLNVELCKVYDKNKDSADETKKIGADVNLQSTDMNMQIRKKSKKQKVEAEQVGENGNLVSEYDLKADKPQIEPIACLEKKNKKKRTDILISDVIVTKNNENVEEEEAKSDDKSKKKKRKKNIEDSYDIPSEDINNDAAIEVESTRKKKKDKLHLKSMNDSKNEQNQQDGISEVKKAESEEIPEEYTIEKEETTKKSKENGALEDGDLEPSENNQTKGKDLNQDYSEKKKNRKSFTKIELEELNVSKSKKKNKSNRRDKHPDSCVVELQPDKNEVGIDGKIGVESNDLILKEHERSRKAKRKSGKFKAHEYASIQCEHEDMNPSKSEQNKLSSTEAQESVFSTKKKKSDKIYQNDVEQEDREANQSIPDVNEKHKKNKKRKSGKFEDVELCQNMHKETVQELNISKSKKKKRPEQIKPVSEEFDNYDLHEVNKTLTDQLIKKYKNEEMTAKKTKKKKKNKEDKSILCENDSNTNGFEKKVKKRKSISQPEELTSISESNSVIKKQTECLDPENESKSSLQPNAVETNKKKKRKSSKSEL